MSLVLKSDAVYTGPSILNGFKEYKSRVEADGGYLADEGATKLAFILISSAGISPDNIATAVSASWGIKKESGYATKMYDLFDASGDMVAKKGSKFTHIFDDKKGRYAIYDAGSTRNRLDRAETISGDNSISLFINHFNTYNEDGTRDPIDDYLPAIYLNKAGLPDGTPMGERLGYYIGFQPTEYGKKAVRVVLPYVDKRSDKNSYTSAVFSVPNSTKNRLILDTEVVDEFDANHSNPGDYYHLTAAFNVTHTPRPGAIGNYYTIFATKNIDYNKAMQLVNIMYNYM